MSDDPEGRTIAVRDSVLEVFMYLWLESLENETLTAEQQEVYAHYKREMTQGNYSFIDLWLGEIHVSPSLTEWYLGTLITLKDRLSKWVPTIDHHFLNGLKLWRREYSRPFPVILMYFLINDLQWLFYQEGMRPSENFKWFEEGKSGPPL
ncbi:hypothetical protein LGH70_22905 [Hymenobacter sp. BT635]|uniref:Uncharacterized protein n=1 Tax=Hymenobacter nitidus TaxID=2880929 RepID=A0ABS8AJL3_9BACT|nr:hypothetical protein [Hymenobacter nitidus]MCB2380461.1 hypothetical protein [Hymenobacter nitidus]